MCNGWKKAQEDSHHPSPTEYSHSVGHVPATTWMLVKQPQRKLTEIPTFLELSHLSEPGFQVCNTGYPVDCFVLSPQRPPKQPPCLFLRYRVLFHSSHIVNWSWHFPSIEVIGSHISWMFCHLLSVQSWLKKHYILHLTTWALFSLLVWRGSLPGQPGNTSTLVCPWDSLASLIPGHWVLVGTQTVSAAPLGCDFIAVSVFFTFLPSIFSHSLPMSL